MANCCAYTAKVTGPNREAALEFAQGFKTYGRIYSAGIEDNGDDDGSIVIYGDCAWSIESALWPMRENWHGSATKSPFMDKAESLKITLELYAEETGEGFMEHYLIKDGVLILSEECDYRAFDYAYEEFSQERLEGLAREWNYASVEEMLDYSEDGVLYCGGYEYNFDFKPEKPRGNNKNRCLVNLINEAA